jgi:hypothetical protein
MSQMYLLPCHHFTLATVFTICIYLYCCLYLSDAIVSLQPEVRSGELSVSVSLQNESMKYLSGHVIDGRNLFPATGYLVSIISLSHPKKGIVLVVKCSLNFPSGNMLSCYIKTLSHGMTIL